MGSAVIEGYINENKEDDFVAYASPLNVGAHEKRRNLVCS